MGLDKIIIVCGDEINPKMTLNLHTYIPEMHFVINVDMLYYVVFET